MGALGAAAASVCVYVCVCGFLYVWRCEDISAGARCSLQLLHWIYLEVMFST